MTTRLFNIDAIGEMHFKKEMKTKKNCDFSEVILFTNYSGKNLIVVCDCK